MFVFDAIVTRKIKLFQRVETCRNYFKIRNYSGTTVHYKLNTANKAFIYKLRPGISTHASPYGPLRPNVTSSVKPELHNVSQRHQRRTEPRPQGICTKNREGWSSGSRDVLADRQTDTHTDRQTDCNTALPYQGGVMTVQSGRVAIARDTDYRIEHQPDTFPV